VRESDRARLGAEAQLRPTGRVLDVRSDKGTGDAMKPRKKLASVPRQEDEELVRTTLWLTVSDKAWAEAGAGVSQTVRELIRAAREGGILTPESIAFSVKERAALQNATKAFNLARDRADYARKRLEKAKRNLSSVAKSLADQVAEPPKSAQEPQDEPVT
jgi:hypothetical protein